MALAVGLYLYDSALLLFSNEAVLTPRGKDRWLAGFGSTGTTFKGKGLYIPNPLLPARPVFRLAWAFEGGAARPVDPWAGGRKAFARFAPLTWSLAAVMFVLLPVSLTGRFGDWLLLLAFLLIYVNVLCILVLLWVSRKKYSLAAGSFAAIALDLLVCPPFALNLIRRLSLRVPVREDFIAAAKRLQTPGDWQATRLEVLARLDDEIAFEDEASGRMAALKGRRSGLAAEGGECPAPN